MEEKAKGFSLRKNKASRRPPISFPKQISSPAPSAVSSPASQAPPRVNGSTEKLSEGPRERRRPGGNTSDLVKRRYSTRFTQVLDYSSTSVPPVPTLPAIPGPFAQRSSGEIPPSTQKISADLVALRDPGLQVEKYATDLLSDATDQELQEYQTSLRKIKNRTSSDLQHNVYQNRTQFIRISKEAEKLKGEMRTLRGLMSELTSTLGQASVGSSAFDLRSPIYEIGATRARKHANRTSVANLEAMWNVQLQALWKNVEGSQKFLPAIPGRHVVHESGYWVELDAATWKPRRPVHIFLLNDHLMVATRKRKRIDPNTLVNGSSVQKAPTKLVAERCWPLQDIDLLDLDLNSIDSPGKHGTGYDITQMSDAISVRFGHQSFTYRGETSANSEKASLLLAFRRAADELRRGLRVDAEDTNNKTKETLDYFATRDPAVSKKVDLLRSISISKDRPEILIDVDGKQKNFRWIEAQIDDLDIDVALQRFEEAVKNVEKLRRLAKGLKGNDGIAQNLINIKVDERASKLAEFITQRLVDTHSFLNATLTNVSWLVSLGFEDRAREAYLQARTAVITKRARQCVFEGDLHQYIFQVSFVYFTIARNTVSIYQQCFPPVMMSACVKWAKEHLDKFNVILARQLSSVKRDSPTWQECMERAREHASMMDEVGLDFKDLVGVGLSEA